MAEITDAMYRKLQSDFVSNQNGTSKWEIVLISTTAPLGALLRNALSAFLLMNTATPKSCHFVLDFATLVIPLLLCLTVLSSHVHAVLTTLTFMIVAILTVNHGLVPASKSRQPAPWSILNLKMDNRRPFITHYRAYVLITTVISILAVDFTIFPRRFCKAESFGTGLMDIGVGGFVISNALVSPEARYKNIVCRSLKEKLGVVMKTLRSCLPLVVLGLSRVVAVKGTDYQEHVTEYGTHWNFFFTLAAVKLLSTLALSVFPIHGCGVLGGAIAALYEYFLHGRGLKEVVLLGTDGSGARADLFNANREGIVSVVGYLGIYLICVQFGRFLFRQRSAVRDWLNCLAQLALMNALSWVILSLAETHIDLVSRRMANFQFVIWMLCYNVQSLCCFLAGDILWTVYSRVILERGVKHTDGESVRKYKSFCLLDAVNRNGLLCFLLSNVLTGLVNFSMRTLFTSTNVALTVNVVYLIVVFSIMSFFHALDITVRYW